MSIVTLFSWWYGNGWSGVLRSTRRRLGALGAMFSVAILLHTLFAPWRRIITYPGASIDAKLRAFGDNLVSRCVGFVVRFFVLLAAGVAFAILCVFAVLELIAWPLLPIAAVVLIIRGVF